MKTDSNSALLCNPLLDIRLGTDFEIDDVNHLTSIIVDPNGEGSQNHWSNAASILITGLILHYLYKRRKANEQVSLFDLVDRLSPDLEKAWLPVWSEMEMFRVDGKNHPVISFTAKYMMNMQGREAEVIVSTAKHFFKTYMGGLRERTIEKQCINAIGPQVQNESNIGKL